MRYYVILFCKSQQDDDIFAESSIRLRLYNQYI